MSKHDRYASGAIGFVIGVALISFFIAWSEVAQAPNNESSNRPSQQETSQSVQDNKGDGHNWVSWPERFAYTEDSLAQWLMALFAVVAALISLIGVKWVRDTLIESRKTADQARIANEQARDLFVSENRPWLKVLSATPSSLHLGEGPENFYLDIQIKNLGASPALNVEAHIKVVHQILPIVFASEVAEFASQCIPKKPSALSNHGVFPGDETRVFGSDDDIGNMRGNAIVCITYRSSISPDRVFHTAFSVSLAEYQRGWMSNDSFSIS